MFCGNFYLGRGQYPPCQIVWCGFFNAKQLKDEFPKSGKYSGGDWEVYLEGSALCSYWKSSVSVPCSLGSTCEYLVYIV